MARHTMVTVSAKKGGAKHHGKGPVKHVHVRKIDNGYMVATHRGHAPEDEAAMKEGAQPYSPEPEPEEAGFNDMDSALNHIASVFDEKKGGKGKPKSADAPVGGAAPKSSKAGASEKAPSKGEDDDGEEEE
ncbi:MAG TPA: hypothetical protein VKX49_12755 [Bryobacteraceae bacterium]|nr:hypothetical protein [Bryobacteraceae bacterium]